MNRRELEFLGAAFETQVVLKLREDFPDFEVIHGLSVYSQALEKETQIDVVVVGSENLFLIECKNFTVSVRGNYSDSRWEAVSRSKKKLNIFNPLNQDVLHKRALESALFRRFGVKPGKVRLLVCFPESIEIFSDVKELCTLETISNVIRKDGIGDLSLVQPLRKINQEELRRQREVYGLEDVRATHFSPREE